MQQLHKGWDIKPYKKTNETKNEKDQSVVTFSNQ